jgi:hypothetical protein
MPDRERDDATGLYAEKAPLDAVREVFDRVRGPVVTSSDVAEHLDCTTETARRKLKELYEQGAVDKRTTGRTTVWWFTGGEPITPDERASPEETIASTSTETDSDTDDTDALDGDSVYDPTEEFDD